ncbi:MAG: hypothetical protein WCA81_14840 [Rhizomicrobium sp.]
MESPAPLGFFDVGRVRSGSVRTGEARSGTTGKPFDEPATQNPTALRVSRWRALFGGRSIHRIDRFTASPLRRSTDVPASPFAPRLAAYAAAQLRSALYLIYPPKL